MFLWEHVRFLTCAAGGVYVQASQIHTYIVTYIDVCIWMYTHFCTCHMMYRAVCCGWQAGVAVAVFAQKAKTPGLTRASLPFTPLATHRALPAPHTCVQRQLYYTSHMGVAAVGHNAQHPPRREPRGPLRHFLAGNVSVIVHDLLDSHAKLPRNVEYVLPCLRRVQLPDVHVCQ